MTAISRQPSPYDQHSSDVVYYLFVFYLTLGHQNMEDVGA